MGSPKDSGAPAGSDDQQGTVIQGGQIQGGTVRGDQGCQDMASVPPQYMQPTQPSALDTVIGNIIAGQENIASPSREQRMDANIKLTPGATEKRLNQQKAFEAVQKAIKESQRKQAANLFASTPPSDMSEVGRRTDNTLLDVLYPSPPVDPASDPRGPFPTDVVTPFEPLPTNIPTSAEGADMDLYSGGELQQFGLAPGESAQMANRVNRGGILGIIDKLVGDRLGTYGQLANVGLKGAQNLGRDVSDLFKGDFRFGPPQQNLGGGGGGGAMMPPMMQDPCPEGYKLIGGKCEPVDDVTQPIATTPAPMSAPLPQFEQKTQYTPVAPINPFILDPKRR